jgi:hypothetical protein
LSGNNILRADEISIGLLPHDLNVFGPDELDALDLSQPPNGAPVYFSLARGASNSEGADIMVSQGGTVSQVLSADDMGLLASDEVDAIVVQDVDGNNQFGQGDYVLFSVAADAEGKPGSDVEQQAVIGEVAGDVYVSFGDGAHALLIDERDLGLLTTDDVDALELQHTGPFEECGDGILQNPPEQCEVGIPCPPGQACNVNTCRCSEEDLACGDGLLVFPEQCESGFPCAAPFTFCWNCVCIPFVLCGNMALDPGEQCDTPPVFCANPQHVCNNCMCDGCGDANIDPGEQCEVGINLCPPNTACDFKTCRCLSDRKFACPNGVLDLGEECEKGIACPDDQVCDLQNCDCLDLPEGCVLDGELSVPEVCDPTAIPTGCNDGDRCTVDCECVPECNPDGTRQGGEKCDPSASPTGCPSSEACTEDCRCRLYTQRCGDGAWSPPDEECETIVVGGNAAHVGTCDAGESCIECACRVVTPRCGDQVFTPSGPEECDWVNVGGNQASVGCDAGVTCDAKSCECVSCLWKEREVPGLINGDYFVPLCQFIEGPAPPDLCGEEHYHAFQAVVIDPETGQTGLMPDPASNECGFGTVSQVTSLLLDAALACALGDALQQTAPFLNCLK